MPGDVLERHALLVAGVNARPALGEGHGRTHSSGTRDDPGKRQQHEQEKRPRKDNRLQRGRPGFGLVVTAGNVGVEQADQVLIVFHADTGYAEADRPAILRIDRQQPALDQGGTKPDRRDFTSFELLAKLPVRQGFHRALEPEGHGHSQSQKQPADNQ